MATTDKPLASSRPEGSSAAGAAGAALLRLPDVGAGAAALGRWADRRAEGRA